MSDWDKFTAGLTQGMPVGMNLWAMLQDRQRYLDEQEQRQADRDVEQSRYNREIKYRDLQDEEAQSRYERELNRIKTGEMEETADNTYFRDLLRGALEGNRLPESGLPPAGTGYAVPGGQGMTYTDPKGPSMSLPGANALPTGISPFQEREPSLEYGSLGSPEMLNDPDALMRLISMAGSENLFRPVTPPDTFDPAQFMNFINLMPYLPEGAELPPEYGKEQEMWNQLPPERQQGILHPPAEPLPPHYFNPESGFGVWDPNTGSISTVPGTGSRGGGYNPGEMAPFTYLGGLPSYYSEGEDPTNYAEVSGLGGINPDLKEAIDGTLSMLAQRYGFVATTNIGAYNEREVRGQEGTGIMSQHADGNALDLRGFVMPSGEVISFDQYNQYAEGSPERAMLDDIWQTFNLAGFNMAHPPGTETHIHIGTSGSMNPPGGPEEPAGNHTDTVNDWWESLDQSMRRQYNTEFAQMGYTANSQTVRDRAYDRYGQSAESPTTGPPSVPAPTSFQPSGVEGADRYGQEFEASVDGFVENAKASGWSRDYVIMMLKTYIEQYGLTGVVTAEEIYAEEFGS